MRRRCARISAFPPIDLSEKVIRVSMIDDRAWRNATFSSFPRERPVFLRSRAVYLRFFDGAGHRCVRVKCIHVNVEAEEEGGKGRWRDRAHWITTRISLAARSRVYKIVRVSHDIIISGTKNEINIIRTGAVILLYVTRDEYTRRFTMWRDLLPSSPLYLVISSGWDTMKKRANYRLREVSLHMRMESSSGPERIFRK